MDKGKQALRFSSGSLAHYNFQLYNINFDFFFALWTVEREFYLSYKRLAAVFKAEKGISMQQCHDRLKMEEACRLLRSTLMPVSEAAAAVGFADPLYFSRRFRQIVGKSPTEFRRAAAEMF